MIELNMVLLDKSGGLRYNVRAYSKPQPVEGRVKEKGGSDMEALRNFIIDNYDIVTLVVVAVIVTLVFCAFIAFSNSVAKTKEGRGFRRSMISQIIAFAFGAIAMYLWSKYM